MKLFDEILHCPDEQGWTNPNVSRTKNIVEIAENFAIGFAMFVKSEYKDIFMTKDNYKQLLEIYKKTL